MTWLAGHPPHCHCVVFGAPITDLWVRDGLRMPDKWPAPPPDPHPARNLSSFPPFSSLPSGSRPPPSLRPAPFRAKAGLPPASSCPAASLPPADAGQPRRPPRPSLPSAPARGLHPCRGIISHLHPCRGSSSHLHAHHATPPPSATPAASSAAFPCTSGGHDLVEEQQRAEIPHAGAVPRYGDESSPRGRPGTGSSASRSAPELPHRSCQGRVSTSPLTLQEEE
nr:proline-rich receptor-like protein kinase PERK2 [Lolium perenne]